jgi:predicted phage terminase large subunit-like protein
MSITTEEKIQAIKEIYSKDILFFGTSALENHFKKKTPEFHKEIIKELVDENQKLIAIGAPRGHSKSTLVDLLYLLWVIINKKAKFVLLISDTYSQAVLFLDAVKAELEGNDLLKGLYGNLETNNWSEGEIIVNGIMVKALGAGMKVRGLKFRESRPDLVIVDDLENDELVQSKERREKLERWFNGALLPSLAEDGNAKVIVIGTILHFDSLLAKLLSDKYYTNWYKKTYKAVMNGKAIWSEHLTIEQLEEKKKQYTENGQLYLFYSEYMNEPVSSENCRFPIEKFNYFTEEEISKKQLRTYITIDRAYSKEKTADSTGIIVNSVDNDNNWYIRQAERFKGTEKELIEKIIDLKQYYNPTKIAIEQKAFEYTIKPALDTEMRIRSEFFVVEELKDGGRNKNMRIEGLVPRFLSKSMFFKQEQTDLIDELVTFPKAVHDDLSDALAYQLMIANHQFTTNNFTAKKKTFI